MSYYRVIPRDLFNEAKLLKCHGMLSLAILDHKQFMNQYVDLNHEDEESGFNIHLCESTGNLFIGNITAMKIKTGERIDLHHKINSKVINSLYFESEDYETEGYVFDDDGEFTSDFLEYIKEESKEAA